MAGAPQGAGPPALRGVPKSGICAVLKNPHPCGFLSMGFWQSQNPTRRLTRPPWREPSRGCGGRRKRCPSLRLGHLFPVIYRAGGDLAGKPSAGVRRGGSCGRPCGEGLAGKPSAGKHTGRYLSGKALGGGPAGQPTGRGPSGRALRGGPAGKSLRQAQGPAFTGRGPSGKYRCGGLAGSFWARTQRGSTGAEVWPVVELTKPLCGLVKSKHRPFDRLRDRTPCGGRPRGEKVIQMRLFFPAPVR